MSAQIRRRCIQDGIRSAGASDRHSLNADTGTTCIIREFIRTANRLQCTYPAHGGSALLAAFKLIVSLARRAARAVPLSTWLLAPAEQPQALAEDAVRRPDLSRTLPLELVRCGAADSLLPGHDRAGDLRHPPLHALLPLLQVPQELQPQSRSSTSTNCPG